MLSREVRASKTFTLIVVCVAIFTDVFIYGLMIPVMPFALTSRLGVAEKDVQMWNSILLGILGFMILFSSLGFGWLSDRIRSRRTPYIVGLTLLFFATVLFALAPNLPLVLVARTFQGAATAIVFTIGYTLLFDKVGSKGLGQALGYASLSLSLGWFLGPVVGGLIYAKAGYFAVFAPALGLIVIEIGLRLLMMEDYGVDTKAPETEEYHPRNETTPTTSTTTTGLAGEVAPLLRPAPATPPRTHAMVVLLSSPRLVIGVTANCILNGLMVASDSVLPVFIKDVFEYDSSQVALVFLCLLFPMMLCPLFGKLTDRVGVKLVTLAAFGIAVPTLALLRFVAGGSRKDLVVLVVLLFALGLSFALGSPALSLEIMHTVEEIEERNPGIFGPHGATAQAYGISNAAQGIGMTIGPIGAGFLRVFYGWTTMTEVLAAVSAMGLIIIIPLTGGRLFVRG